jgi:hypothetical protein
MRRIVSLVLLGLLLAALFASVAEARQSIKGPGFRSYAPSGWVVTKQNSRGWKTVNITPPRASSKLRDAAVVSIAVASVKWAERSTKTSIRDKASMIKRLVYVPQEATNAEEGYAPRPTTLGGKAGVSYAIHYTYKGKGSAQVATLVRSGKRVYLIQVITDEDLSQLGQTAVGMVTEDWRWK